MGLKNRTKISTTLENNLSAKINQLSKDTRIPKSKLFDEAVELLLERYKKDNKEKNP